MALAQGSFLEHEMPPPSRQNSAGVIKFVAQAAAPTSGAQRPEVGPDDGALTGPKRRSKRTSVLSQEAEETLKESDPAAYDKLKSPLGQSFQVLLLVGTVFAYVGNPILVTWAKTVGKDSEGEPIRTTTFMEPLLIMMMKAAMTCIGLAYAFSLDRGTGSWTHVARIFNKEDLIRWNWCALGWTIADVAEQMAGGRLDPALYTVLSQSRLVATAIVMRVFLGTKRVTLQWSILVNLSLVIIGFRMIGTDSKNTELLGFLATAVKMVLSVVCGVYAQGLLQTYNADLPYIVIITQMTLLSVFWMLFLIPLFIYYVAPEIANEPWHDPQGNFYGLFGAPPYCPPPLRGSPYDEVPGCLASEAVAVLSWRWEVWVVLAFNVYRDYTVNYIIKVFDALIKNLCNSFATVVSYGLNVVWLGAPFDRLKAIFSCVIALEIAHYAMAQDMPWPKEEDDKSATA